MGYRQFISDFSYDFEMILEWFGDWFGVFLEWFGYAFGMILGWCWDGFGMSLAWSGMILKTFLGEFYTPNYERIQIRNCHILSHITDALLYIAKKLNPPMLLLNSPVTKFKLYRPVPSRPTRPTRSVPTRFKHFSKKSRMRIFWKIARRKNWPTADRPDGPTRTRSVPSRNI